MSDHGWPWFWNYYRSGAWEPATRDCLADHLAEGDLFVDVGAWIGPVTLWALDLGADVIAIEPDPVACAELRKVVPSTVEIWEGAVATYEGTANLAANTRPGGEYGDSMSRLSGSGTEVACWTLPTILKDRCPDLVKIDIEGYEVDLCPALAPWLAERKVPVRVSCHGALPAPDCFAGFGHVTWPDDTWGDLLAVP